MEKNWRYVSVHHLAIIIFCCVGFASHTLHPTFYVASQQEPNQEHSRRRGGYHAAESPTQSASTQAEIELGRPSLASINFFLFWHYICIATIF